MTSLLFLPGAGGAASFFHPLGEMLPREWNQTFLGWPGAGHEPHDPAIRSFEDLTRFAAARLPATGAVVIAQSMGGIVALELARRWPQRIAGVVLCATSGGIDMGRFGAAEWRGAYRAEFPNAATWVVDERPDLARELGNIVAPILLLFGDADPLAPVAAGRHLADCLARSELHVIEGGDHGFARDRVEVVAPLVMRFVHSFCGAGADDGVA